MNNNFIERKLLFELNLNYYYKNKVRPNTYIFNTTDKELRTKFLKCLENCKFKIANMYIDLNDLRCICIDMDTKEIYFWPLDILDIMNYLKWNNIPYYLNFYKI